MNAAPIITVNWKADEGQKWTVPFGGGRGKLLMLGRLPLNVQLGTHVNVVKPDIGPDWSRSSGGVERTDLETVWEERAQRGELELRSYLLAAFLAVFLVEAFLTRVGFRLPELRVSFAEPREATKAATPLEAVEAAEPAEPEPEPEPELVSVGEERRRRFARAKSER